MTGLAKTRNPAAYHAVKSRTKAPEPRMRDVAPRLWKALEDERAYQKRRAYEYARGRLSMTVAFEEMARSMRQMSRAYSAQIQRLRERGLFG